MLSPIAVLIDNFIIPFVVASVFNTLQQLAQAHQAPSWSMFYGRILLFGIISLVAVAVWRIQVFFVWRYQTSTIRDMIVDIFSHIESQGYHFHSNRFGGALVSQANKFVSGYERFMDEFTWSILTLFTSAVATVVLMAHRAPIFAVVVFIVAVSHVSIMIWRMKVQSPFNRAEAQSESSRTAQLADSITNISTVRSFGHEDIERKLFMVRAQHTWSASRRLLRAALVNDIINNGIVNALEFFAMLTALYVAIQSHTPIGTIYLIMTYTLGLTRRLWEFGRVLRNINRAFGDTYDMTAILQIRPEIQDIKNPEPARFTRGAITFDNVSFRYEEDSVQNTELFSKLNMRIKPGEKVGLVGPSGGGKTTITNLILRYMDIQDGNILIDGQDICRVNQQELRSHIAYVPQESILFHRSISDNIAYGKPGVNQTEIEKIAKLAHAHEFIKDLPKGYETMVGERGVKLSGGQRQRIAIARAMIKDAPILVLDEATSALDSESEKLIQDALWKLMEGRTTIVIAHRLSTIAHMDRIIVLDKGTVIEEGTHKALLANKGKYAELWTHQSGGFLED